MKSRLIVYSKIDLQLLLYTNKYKIKLFGLRKRFINIVGCAYKLYIPYREAVYTLLYSGMDY